MVSSLWQPDPSGQRLHLHAHLLAGGTFAVRCGNDGPASIGGVVDGKEVKMTVKVGDKVLTSKYSGTEVKVDGEECTIVRQSDILAVVED